MSGENVVQATANRPPEFLAGGGEMGALMRSWDWSHTVLGPIDTWSPTLRMMVSFLLANRFPLLLWWGPDYISIYNDAYRPILGVKHPWALGKPVKECWSEIWHVLQPLIDAPFTGGPSTWMDDIELHIQRKGYTEETHFTVAYSPVPDETAPRGIGGVLATVHEITDKVVGARRLQALRDLGARASEAKSDEAACVMACATLAAHPKDVPFAILYLLDPDSSQAHLAGACGVEGRTGISPQTIRIDQTDADGSWPLAECKNTQHMQRVENLGSRFDSVPAGPWPDPPHTAVILPVASNMAHQLAGFLVAGVSSRLKLDDSYENFLQLATTHVATAIANARAYEEERKRAAALAELDRAKTAFFSNVSHEFRTPLTLILGPLEDMLAGRSGIPAETRERLEVAHRNSIRLLRLINTLLDFSRIEAGRIEAVYESTDLARFTAELASVFRSAIERAGLGLKVHCPPLPEAVFVDREMWEKIVFNLLSNAFKYTFEGEIEVALAPAGEAVELSVKDTGTGIPAEEIPRLFERFHRVKNARGRSLEGTGIGLALVQELAKLHGGAVRVESEIDRGSCFIVSIPRGDAHLPADRMRAARTRVSTKLGGAAYVEEAMRWLPDTDRQSASTLAGSVSEIPPEGLLRPPVAPSSRPRILLADDNADMRDYVRRLLEESYEVTAVADGAAALESVRERAPDLVLTDIMMPGLDGFELLRELRSSERSKTIPVVLLSARAGEDSRVEGMEAGADDYLVKPFSAKELLACVGARLEIARIRRETETALRESEMRFRNMADNAPVCVWVTEPDGACTYLNRRWYELTGQTEETALGLGWLEAVHPDDKAEVMRTFLEASATQEPFRLDYRIRRHDGEYRWTIDAAAPRFGPNAEFLGYVGSVFDITDRKRAEAEREKARQTAELLNRVGPALNTELDVQTLTQRVTDLATALTNAQFGAFFHNVVNDQGESYMLYTLSGAPREAFSHLPMPRNTAVFGPTFRGEGVVRSGDITKDPRYGKSGPHYGMPEGHLPVRSYLAVPVVSRSGVILGGLFFGHEMAGVFTEQHEQIVLGIAAQAAIALDNAHLFTQSRRNQEELFRSNAELRRANADLEQFAYSASHDLQEPIRNIAIYGEVLNQHFGQALDEQAKEYLGYVTGGAKRMDVLVKDLLAYTQSARMDGAVTEAIDVTVALEKALSNLARAISETNAKVSYDKLPSLRVHEVQLQQLFQNLVGNAIKYRSDDEPPCVHVAAELIGDEWLFSVRDNGIGIAPEYKTRVFGIFKRLHSAEKYSGTGIGLAICQRIVEKNGGRIWVESEGPGKGSTFHFTLPAGAAK